MPMSSDGACGGEENRRIAALILRNAREQAELAEEEGNSAYLADSGARARGPGRVNERLLRGEVNQMRSFNKRAGVDVAALPALPAQQHHTPLQREVHALDKEFVKRAHGLREGGDKLVEVSKPRDAFASLSDRRDAFANFGDRRGQVSTFGWGEKSAGPCFEFAKGACSRENCRFSHDPRDRFDAISTGVGKRNAEPPELQRKRQRVGANGVVVDIAAAEEEAARQAEEDLELANPLLRGPVGKAPPGANRRLPDASVASNSCARSGRADSGAQRPVVDVWASKRLRVRIVDTEGDFQEKHLRKGIVRCVDESRCSVDLELEGDGGKILHAVPLDLLETVVSKSCTRVEIVRGPRRGMLAELLQRDPKHNVAVVRLGRASGEAEIELPLDDVCEYL